ncbi:histidinol dehydrogenase [Elusimicrobiota bacterium]
MDRIKNYTVFSDKVMSETTDIIKDVWKRGDEAVIECTGKFDKIELTADKFEVKQQEIEKSAVSLDPELEKVIKRAAENIENYHRQQKQRIPEEYEIKNKGIVIKDKLVPVERVGLYVPGGNYPYPSTVLMCAIPAKIAGVGEIIMVTPAKNITPAVLAAARIAGVDRIFRIGGAHAVAALAYGTKTVPKVDKIAGPGNNYVQCAKWLVSSVVGIDMISGPSEVVIIADENQDPERVAVDLLSQYEHANDASAILLTDTKELIDGVKKKVEEYLSGYKPDFNGRIEYKCLDNLDMAAEASNRIAPEHLQLMLDENNMPEVYNRITNAGAVFLGSETPVALGDYWAGPSHALPTGQCAKFQEGLNVRSFLKKVSFIKSSRYTIKEEYPDIKKFAEAEGMAYHAMSLKRRIEDEE